MQGLFDGCVDVKTATDAPLALAPIAFSPDCGQHYSSAGGLQCRGVHPIPGQVDVLLTGATLNLSAQCGGIQIADQQKMNG